MTITPGPLALVNGRGFAASLTPYLQAGTPDDAAWSAAPSGISRGLRAEKDGEHASVHLDRKTFTLEMSGSAGATDALTTVVRDVYIRYLDACLTIRAFQLESVPVEGAAGVGIVFDILRELMAERGAQWLGRLPGESAAASRRVPSASASEVTIVDVPGEAEGGDDVTADKGR